jgi:hypothetical protein
MKVHVDHADDLNTRVKKKKKKQIERATLSSSIAKWLCE